LLRDRGYGIVDFTAEDVRGAEISARQGMVDGIDALVVVGGDGMVHLGVNLMAMTNLPLGIVAEGTGNDIARGLGLPIRDVEAAVEQIHGALGQGGRTIDAVRVTDLAHPQMAEWYVGVLSAGFDAAVNARTNALTWPSGSARYVRALLRELRDLAPFGYRIAVDGEELSFPGTLVSVANGVAFGGGMHIAPNAEFDDGLLDVVIAGPLTRRALMGVFPKVYKGAHLTHPAVSVLRGTVVTVEADPELGSIPPAAYADGEPLGPLPLRCEVVPGALRVLAPPGPSGGSAPPTGLP
jgi:diacylglycerol kinase (ATP)